MKDLLLPLLHLAVTAAKLCRPGGVRAVIAENLLLKQQLIVRRRSRQRAPNLRVGDRLLCGCGGAFSESGTDSHGRHRTAPVHVADLPSGAGARQVPPIVLPQARDRRSRAQRGRASRSSAPSSSSHRALLDSGARGLRASSRRRSGSTSTRTSCTALLAKRSRPAPGGTGPSWLSFVGHTTDSRWSVDLLRSASIVLQSDWALVVMDQFTRRLVGFGVHRGPVDAPSLCRMCNAAIHGRGAPRHLSTDHDPLFEAHRWTANLRLLEIDEIKTVPHVPLSHPLVETADRDDAARMPGSGVVLECR